jgi:hypothetical protein
MRGGVQIAVASSWAPQTESPFVRKRHPFRFVQHNNQMYSAAARMCCQILFAGVALFGNGLHMAFLLREPDQFFNAGHFNIDIMETCFQANACLFCYAWEPLLLDGIGFG